VPVAVTQGEVLAGKSVVAVAAGGTHSLATCSDGTLAAWGANSTGQLGNGGTTSSSVPVVVPQSWELVAKAVVAAAAGNSHSLALAARAIASPVSTLSNLVLSTGRPTPESLNPAFSSTQTVYATSVRKIITSITVTPTVADAPATVTVNGAALASGSASPPIALAIGNNTISVVVTAEDGATQSTYTIVVTRGIWNVTITSADSVPDTAPSYDASGMDIAITLGFTPPTGSNLTVINNTGIGFIAGQFGNLAQGQAVNLTYNGVTYQFVANYYGGSGNDLVLQWARQDLAAWGDNSSGQLGNNSTTNSSVPVAVTQSGVLAGKTVISVAAGRAHSIALCSDGTLAAWGGNDSGQLGNSSTMDSRVPVAVTQSGILAGKTMVAIAAGEDHSLVLCSDGTLAAWGDNSYGQLGNNSTTSSNVPVAVAASDVWGETYVAIAAGSFHNLALGSDGKVVAWGDNYFGQLTGNSVAYRLSPTYVGKTGVLTSTTVISIEAGYAHSLALCADGTLAAWGYNSKGQLGNNSTATSSLPVAVTQTGILTGKSVVSLSAGWDSSLALCADGTLAAWGDNSAGQLGNNTTSDSRVPVAVTQNGVLAGKTVVAVTARENHNLALCSDGTLAAWGDNGSGQLGNGGTSSSNVPVAVTQSGVLAGKVVCGVAAGVSHNLALVAGTPATAPTVAFPTCAALGETSATLGGTVTSDGGSPVTDCGVVYAVTSTNAVPQIGGAGVTQLSTTGSAGTFNVHAAGLAGFTGYSFKAYAINAVGTTYTTPVSSFTTPATDLAISMNAAPVPVTSNGSLTYTIQVTNNGSCDAAGVSVRDSLPPEVAFVSAIAPAGWSASLPAVGSSGLVSFDKASALTLGDTATFTIVSVVRSTGATGAIIVNSATASTASTESNPGNNTASTSTAVGTLSPSAVQLNPGMPKPKYGLFKLSVSVTNTTPLPINGFRLHVGYSAYLSAYPSLRLSNASSPPESSDVFIDVPYPVAVDGTVLVELDFTTTTLTFRETFAPVLTVEALTASAVANTNGAGVQPSVTKLPNKTVLVEFPSVTGHWYRIGYSADLVDWFDSPVPVQAGGSRLQWIDSGPPLTDFSPADPAVARRFYRVNQITSP